MLLNKRCIVSFSSFSPTAVLATKSRTFDPSFSSCSDISLHNYKTNKTTTLDQDLRFNTVLWCESPSYSFLSAGQENGTFQIFKHYDDTLHPYYTNSTHLTGDITAMSYNHSKHLLSIGGSSSKIILYDINTPDKPFLAPQIKPDTFHISSLSFNPKVSHILCAGTTTGSIVVLDLRQKKEVLRISHPHLQHITQILWHPLSTTSILASSPTSILSFDLSTDTTTTLVTTKYLNTFSIHNSNSDNPFLLYTTPTSITTQPLSLSTNTSNSNNINIPFTTSSNNISDLQLSTYTPLLSSISYTDGKTLLTNILNIHNTPYITPYNNSNLTVTSYNLYSYNNKCYNIYKLPKIYMSSDINKNTLIYRIYSIMVDSDKGSNVLDKGKGLCRDVRKRIGDLIFSEYNKDRLEGDNDKDRLEEGVSNRDRLEEGDSNRDSSSKQQGDNDSISKQQGDNDSTNKQHPLIKSTSKQQGDNDSTIKQHPLSNSTNKQHPISTTFISFDLKDVITLSLLKGDFINAYDLSLKSKEQHPLIYTILLCMNKEEIKVKIKELRNKTKNDKIHLLLCVLCNEYKYVVDNVVLEQWYVVLYLLCYIDVCYDEYSELLTILGDRLSNSRLEGVSDKVTSVKGDNNSTSKEEGVNNSTSKEEGVNYKDKEQHPLNNSTNEQHPLNNSTNEQHPLDNSTDEQHPFTNNTYTYYSLICYLLAGNLKKYFKVRNNEFEIPKSVFKVIETLKKYGSVVGECYTMGGVNDSILMREYSKYNKVSYKDRVEGVSSKVSKMEVRGVSGKNNILEGVSNSTSGLKGVIEPTNALHPFNNNTYKQQGVGNNTYKQHPFTPTPQHPVTPSIPKPLTRQYTPPIPNTSNTGNIPTSSISSMPSTNTPSIPPSNIPPIPPTTNIPTKPHTYGQLRNSKTYGQLTSKITPPLNTTNTTPFNNKEDNIRTTGYTKPIDTNISSSMGSGYVKPLNRTVPLYNKPISPPLSTSSNIGVSSTNTYPSPPPTNPSPTTNTTTNINNNPPHTNTNTTDIINTIDKRVLLIKRLASKKKGLIYKNKINECLRRLECYNNINKNDIPIDILNKLKEVLYIVSEEEVLLCEEEKRLCDLRDVWYEKVRCVCEDIVRCYGGVKGVDVWVVGIVGLLQIGLSDRGNKVDIISKDKVGVLVKIVKIIFYYFIGKYKVSIKGLFLYIYK
ncbi:hypothetical protein CWI38_0301p0020 [Hamiltosporidium tvaerminnensis]|uniref:Protein transport protein SEC31 n=1 Tax=Hamiltosporidium tvaerminnensis TaxID=1176355 RepID=A0A4Q9LYH9_9MICR|nr:hypothetical protein CWI38_0301p0020 [Hamiltosporidium tvaerminnensis]